MTAEEKAMYEAEARGREQMLAVARQLAKDYDYILVETGDRVSLTPTHFIFRPSDLEKLGLTVGEVTKMIKEKNV